MALRTICIVDNSSRGVRLDINAVRAPVDVGGSAYEAQTTPRTRDVVSVPPATSGDIKVKLMNTPTD